MKKDLIFIALLIVAAILMCISCYFGGVSLCEAVGRELTENNIQWGALVIFGCECYLITAAVIIWALHQG